MNNKIEGVCFNPESDQEYQQISNELYEAVENSTLEDGEFIEAGGVSFYVLYFDDLEEGETQAWLSWNSSLADVDIYIHNGLEDVEKKRAMFHEMFETIAYQKMDEEDVDDLDDSIKEKSHVLALEKEEERFGKRKENLNID